MSQHDVLLKAVVNVRVRAVEAEGQAQAVEAALGAVDLYRLFQRESPRAPVAYTEYGEEVHEVLVDEVGDEQYERSAWLIQSDRGWIRAPDEPAASETDDSIQFPRLIAELAALGVFDMTTGGGESVTEALAREMDLVEEQVCELIDRAEVEWGRIKRRKLPRPAAKQPAAPAGVNPERCILLVGNPGDGFTAYGPFDTEEDASDYAQSDQQVRDDTWWVLPTVSVRCDDDGNWITSDMPDEER